MKKPLASKITFSLNDSLSESDSGDFETITLRPDEDVAAMISALNELLRLTIATLFVDEISEKLCELLIESKNNQSLVQEFLGHSSLGTTQRYTHVSPERLRSAFGQAHPRA